MGKIIQLKTKQKNDKRFTNFMKQLGIVSELFLHGKVDNVLIIVNGKDLKACTSNGVNVANAKEMCRYFIRNAGEYID